MHGTAGVCTAYLRVYEPLAAFGGAERRYWEQYAADGRAPSREDGPALERAASLRAATGVRPAVVPDLEEHAFVAEVDGVTLVCPWRTRLRSMEALTEFVGVLPDELADAFVPRSVAEAVDDELAQTRAERPDLRVPVLSATWQVPLRWFVLVDREERQVSTGSVRTARELVYRTPMSRARRRTARALSVLHRTMPDSAVEAGVEDLGRWLEEFHPRSMVELDYGGLVHLLDDAELQTDESARDIALALAALSEGDAERARAAYERVSERMKALQAVESAS